MKNLPLLFFTETTEEGFPGFLRNRKIEDLPIFGKYRIKEVHESFTLKSNENVFVLTDSSDLSKLIGIFNSEDVIVLARSSNILCLSSPLGLQQLHEDAEIIKYRVGMRPSDLYSMRGDTFNELLRDLTEGSDKSFSTFVMEVFDKILFYRFTKLVDINGWSLLIRNICEYHGANLYPLTDPDFSPFVDVIYRNIPTLNHDIKIGRNGFVKNSFLGPGSYIDGFILNSAISGSVKISKNARVMNSVILSGNEIEENVLVENTVILDGKGRKIGKNSTVGRKSSMKNADYPEVIKNGITVIGENTPVPPHSKIGSGCFVGGLNEPEGPIYLNDGESMF
ncbi:MAG: hypothetical protein DRP54_06790 [Spirochaetes bacterium]|nr:MAG: hypothetical protein DRP54_06790 [Spirochaetota bacterium]